MSGGYWGNNIFPIGKGNAAVWYFHLTGLSFSDLQLHGSYCTIELKVPPYFIFQRISLMKIAIPGGQLSTEDVFISIFRCHPNTGIFLMPTVLHK